MLYLRLLHHSLIGRYCIFVCFSQSFIKSVVSAFATPVPYWKVLYLRLLHRSLIGRCCICVCYTSFSLEGAVSTFATPVPPWSVLYQSAFGRPTPLPHLNVLYLRLLLPVIHKKLYLRLLHQPLIGRCCVCVCYWVRDHSLNGRCCIYVCFSQSFI